MTLTAGTRLGPYEIIAPIGAGGMGEVFRARDTRLGRDVAIKVLPESLATDADRLRRFEQEERTIPSLNHPNILGIHDIGTFEGSPFLVSELLEGATLREKLEAGPLGARRAIEYGLGIAQGLAAAHDKGVVHRDLKPENVFITRDGRVKILDFGLAKLASGESATEPGATMTSAHTLPGMVMGTVGYMSPEQVRGEASDRRSDIFSFGAVLYEMLTGKRAFKRNTSAETMTAILREEPPELLDTAWQGPIGLQRILNRCLEKDVERRFQSASDLAFAIESLSGTAPTKSVPASKPPSKTKWWPWAAAALTLLVLATAAWIGGRLSSAKPLPRYSRLTYEHGFISNARFAKDGQTVVYSAQWANDPMQLYSVRMEFPQSTKLDLPSAALLAMSGNGNLEIALDPDVEHMLLHGTLANAQLSGGAPRAIESEVISADYSPDGATVAISRLVNGKVQVEYPRGHVIYTTSGYVDYLRVAPNGKDVAFIEHPVFGDDRGWVATVDGTGKHTRLTAEYPGIQGLAWHPAGKEIWYTAATVATEMQLFAVTSTGKMRQILASPERVRLFDIAGDGRVLFSSEQYKTEIVAVDPATNKERRGLEWFNGSGLQDISPDGKAVLSMEWGGPAGPLYLVVYRKTDGSAPESLGPGAEPKFSPDGRTVASTILSSPPQLAVVPLGAGEGRKLPMGDLTVAEGVIWFPDNKHVLVRGATTGQALQSYLMDIDGGKPQPLGPSGFRGFAIASDGKRIAGFNLAGQGVVWNKETNQEQPITGIEHHDQIEKWTKDGEALLVFSGSSWDTTLYRVDPATGKRTIVQKIELSDRAGSEGDLSLEYAEDSRTYAYGVRRNLGTLFVVEGLK